MMCSGCVMLCCILVSEMLSTVREDFKKQLSKHSVTLEVIQQTVKPFTPLHRLPGLPGLLGLPGLPGLTGWSDMPQKVWERRLNHYLAGLTVQQHA